MNQLSPQSAVAQVAVSELRRALKLVAAVAGNKSPTASHHLVDVTLTGGEVVFHATDGSVWARSSVRLRGLTPEAAGALAPLPLLRALPNAGNVAVGFDADALVIGGNRFGLAEPGGLQPMPNDAPITTLVSVGAHDLTRVAFAMSRDETRFSLDGVLVQSENGRQRLVATDGHRLSLFDTVQPYEGAAARMPRRVVELVLKTGAPAAHVAVAGEWMHVEMHEHGSLRCKVLSDDFPDYRIVIPKTQNGRFQLARKPLLDVLTRVRKAVGSRHPAAKFVVGAGGVTITGSDGSITVAETLPLVGQFSGSADVGEGFALNAAYVQDLLKTVTSAVVEFGFTDSLATFTLQGVDDRDRSQTYILMPVRL